MRDFLLGIISCVCMFQAGLSDEDCDQAILARRQVMPVPAGGALSLTCVVRHCGLNWTGTWLWKNSTDEQFSTVKDTERHHLIKVTLSAHEAQLTLKIMGVNPADEGSYGCFVTWGKGNSDTGNLMYVNVTAAELSRRDFLPRILICAGVFLCLPIILGLACFLSSEVKPQLLPRAEFIYSALYGGELHLAPRPPPRLPAPQERSSSSHKVSKNVPVPPRSHQKTEVVYADISQDALQHQGAMKEPVQSTVYSLLKFPLKSEEPFAELVSV
ncbi:uncharacterized protein LOC115400843 [Salarias fasciatus]|uniref:Uncharacterized LOC115400843 n=1 Tax=Salarias fasciatus TaxID=181472 RepID=A0A672I6D4_SALFA|nr:uncharacterized protein LOC115400843 [Salarias fasciatus]